jgi:hypothetical protein
MMGPVTSPPKMLEGGAVVVLTQWVVIDSMTEN